MAITVNCDHCNADITDECRADITLRHFDADGDEDFSREDEIDLCRACEAAFIAWLRNMNVLRSV
jgi:hypothetical protein